MSASHPVEGCEPKRRRGHPRVAAILETGTDLFARRGYDAVTMTEIAARSGTAIASLYRFFPSKEALADALIERMKVATREELNAFRERARGATIGDLAVELVAFAEAPRDKRRLAVDLTRSRGLSEEKRTEIRSVVVEGPAPVLREAGAAADEEVARRTATILIGIFRGVREVAPDWTTGRSEKR